MLAGEALVAVVGIGLQDVVHLEVEAVDDQLDLVVRHLCYQSTRFCRTSP